VLFGAASAATAATLRWHHARVLRPVRRLAGLLEALREGDYSLRGAAGGALGCVIYDVNVLADTLQRERFSFHESSRLLAKTLGALDSAVFAFDDDGKLRLSNAAAQHLFGQRRIANRNAAELGLDALLAAAPARVLTYAFPGRSGRFEVRHVPLCADGRVGRLLVVNDVSRVLRDEERQAWQRLLRVLGHEMNNSLAPISSIAGTLSSLAAREPAPEDLHADLRTGLRVIGDRADALARFVAGYSRLTRLPPPARREIEVGDLVRRAARLEQRRAIVVEEGEDVCLRADPDQLEQALINLLRNAVEAMPPDRGEVRLRWRTDAGFVAIEVFDEGDGPPASENLFVPFFTTKPGGSGIGLALVRAIADAHEGGVSLLARADAPGAVAKLWLPLQSHA
jgi:two-component system nitrogen regulation sensor histidine kinase NtrY